MPAGDQVTVRSPGGPAAGCPGARGGAAGAIVFNRTDEPKTAKLRLHIDVNPTDRDHDSELERLLAAGARPAEVGQTGNESWHVLAGPKATSSACCGGACLRCSAYD
jgi:hypothetical protein